MKWISVKERLPDIDMEDSDGSCWRESEIVLVVHGNFIFRAIYKARLSCDDCDDTENGTEWATEYSWAFYAPLELRELYWSGLYESNITHWEPLPEGPIEEKI